LRDAAIEISSRPLYRHRNADEKWIVAVDSRSLRG
jgi:hypothetical protein